MQGTTRQMVEQLAGAMFGLAILSLLGLALVGQMPDGAAGWLLQPGVAAGMARAERCRGGQGCDWGVRLRAMGRYLGEQWQAALLRSLILTGLWVWSGGWGPAWLRLVPWGLWIWRGLGVGWPQWRARGLWGWVERGLWQGERLVTLVYVGIAVDDVIGVGPTTWCVGLCCVICEGAEPQVRVEGQADGSYQATLCGHFTLRVAGDHPFRMRLLVLFLSLLDEPGATRGSRRTRDGRTPFVRQLQMAEWLAVPQPHISLWLRYWCYGPG
jgi:hypothetical protein